jgi:NAD(P)-dependent dehydrogenase (short-subunit alcohol dehydrogenase family)
VQGLPRDVAAGVRGEEDRCAGEIFRELHAAERNVLFVLEEFGAVIGVDLSGRIDVLINNAGLMTFADMLTVEDAVWDNIYAVNVRAPMRIMRAVLSDCSGKHRHRARMYSSVSAAHR